MLYKIIKSNIVYNGFLKIKECIIEHEKHNGGKVTIKRELMEGGSAACVFIYDKKTNKSLLVNQFRIGAKNRKDGAWTNECIAGLIDENENSETAICREAYEEAGIKILPEELELVCKTYPSIGISTKTLTIFTVEKDLSDIREGSIFGTSEEEDIKIILKDLEELKYLALKGKIDFLPQMVAIQHLIINKKI